MTTITTTFACAVIASGALLLAGRAQAANPALIQRGKAAFQYHCSACHGTQIISGHRQLPGTEALTVKYGGKEPGALEKRTDLSPAIVKFYVRHGVSVMPFFRKTMVSDADLNAIAAYLSRNYHAPIHGGVMRWWVIPARAGGRKSGCPPLKQPRHPARSEGRRESQSERRARAIGLQHASFQERGDNPPRLAITCSNNSSGIAARQIAPIEHGFEY